MDEELATAVAEAQRRPSGSRWFIPIRLSPCHIPKVALSDNADSSDVQWIDLFPDWNLGIDRLFEAIQPLLPDELDAYQALKSNDIRQRVQGAEMLTNSSHPAMLRPLVKALYDDASVSYYVVQALRLIQHPAAAIHLVRALDDPFWRGHQYKLVEVLESRDELSCKEAIARYKERELGGEKWEEWLSAATLERKTQLKR
jgi:hypothetical protein